MTIIPKASKRPFKLTTIALMASCLAIPQANADNKFLKGVAVGVGGALLLNAFKKKKRSRSRSRARSRSQVKRKTVRRNKARKSRTTRTTKTRRAVPGIATASLNRVQVKDVQRRLNTLGHDAGTPDGLAGPATRSAVMAFQRSLGNPANGTLNSTEMATLMQRSNQLLPTTVQANALTGGAAGAQPAFPSFGGGANGQLAAASGGVTFPAFGAPATSAGVVAGAGSAAFPAFGAPQQQFAAATMPGVEKSPNPTFPVLTAAPEQTAFGQNANGFQVQGGGFAPVNAPQEDAAKDQEQKSFALAAPAPMTSATPLPMTGDGLSEAPLANVAATSKPAIYNIRTGAPLSEAIAQLAGNGFSACETSKGTYTCTKASGNLTDQVVLRHTTPANGAGVVYLTARTLAFAKPVRRSYLIKRMNDEYPELLQSPDRTLTSDACRAALKPEIGDVFAPLSGQLPKGCTNYQSIRFGKENGTDATTQLTLVFYDGHEHVDPAKQALIDAENQLDEEIKF